MCIESTKACTTIPKELGLKIIGCDMGRISTSSTTMSTTSSTTSSSSTKQPLTTNSPMKEIITTLIYTNLPAEKLTTAPTIVNEPTNTNTQSPIPTKKITDIRSTSVTEYIPTNKQTSETISTTVEIITQYNKNSKTTPIIVQVESEDKSDIAIDLGLDLDTFLKYGIGPINCQSSRVGGSHTLL